MLENTVADSKRALQRFVSAEATFSAHPASAKPIKLPFGRVERKVVTPKVPITALPLGIPDILALFRHRQFKARDLDGSEGGSGDGEGGVLIVVRPNSGIPQAKEALKEALRTLREPAKKLADLADKAEAFAKFAAFVTGLDTLAAAVNQPGFVVSIDPSIRELHEIDLVDRDWDFNTEAEDEFSSLIMIGAPRHGADLFNLRAFKSDKGQLRVQTGPEMVATVLRLDGKQPKAEQPGAKVTPVKASKTFNDTFSSVKLLDVAPPATPK